MAKFLPTCRKAVLLLNNTPIKHHQIRTFLSNAYYCREVWDARLKSPLLQKVKLDELYHDLDLAYQKNNNISAVDVDIYTNAVEDDGHVDELLDLVHKLRLSADTVNTLDSTQHAVVRYLVAQEQYERLLQVLDDRMNYGIFLDTYTSNLLLDTFWKKKDFASGARVASNIMLQEDFSQALNIYLSLLHCYKFLKNPEGWTEEKPVVDDSEEVKVRVKFLRNPYFDNHFDLKNPTQIVGKTLYMAGSNITESLSNTFKVVGLALQQDHEKLKKITEQLLKNNEGLISEALNLLPDDNPSKADLLKLKTSDENIEKLLEAKVKEHERILSEKDIAEQCKIYDEWEIQRKAALERQQKRLEIAQRLTSVEESQKKLKEKEMKLWFFEKEEQLELDIDAKRVFYPKHWFGKKKVPRKINEHYIPPEVQTKFVKDK